MARRVKKSIWRKFAKGVGEGGIKALKMKTAVTRPHEFLAEQGFKKMKDYGSKGGGVKGAYRNRVQTYNPITKKFVKIDTRENKIIGNSDKPYKRVRKV